MKENWKMNDQDKNIKKFLRAVERRLRFPRDVRERVMSDFSSSISARREGPSKSLPWGIRLMA